MPTTLIVPGLKSSGPTHWQTWLEHRVAGSVRVTQRDWNDPHLPDWSSRVRREITRATGPLFIAAHSFGALAAVQAASDYAERITGALFVAPADPEAFGVAEFLPTKPLGFPVILVASTNDHGWRSSAPSTGRASGEQNSSISVRLDTSMPRLVSGRGRKPWRCLNAYGGQRNSARRQNGLQR